MSTRPLEPLTGGTARQAWQALSAARSTRGTLAAYSSLKVTTPEGKKSFRAALQLDHTGRLRVRAFTPVGTEVFVFEVSGGEMRYADHTSESQWTGPFSGIASELGIPADLTADEFAMLLFGYPANGRAADFSSAPEGTVRQGDLEYTVSGLGIGSVRRIGSSWQILYDPPTHPPEKVSFETGEGTGIVVRHLDLTFESGSLEPLQIEPSYHCCQSPRL